MLTNLDWLQRGAEYPPPQEKERIKTYKINEQLFLTKHKETWRSTFEEIARRLRRKQSEVDVILNYQQLLSVKTADFVCGEPPTIESEPDADALLTLLSREQWFTKIYEGVIDISRYGNAVHKIVGNRLTTVSPAYWFPIVDESDLKHIVQHVIAYPTTPNKDGAMTELYVEIHDKGKVTIQRHAYDASEKTVGKLLDKPVTEMTGLDDFAVQPLTNLTCSSSVYGIDDYAAVNSIVAKIMWRIASVDRVLDKHSEPSVSGPSSALELDPRTGLYFLNLGNYFKRNSTEDPDLKYVTWDGNLESSLAELEMLFNQLYIMSEMGQAFSESAGGTADSGEALKLRMVSPRIKAARIIGLNEATIKKTILMLAQVNGITANGDSLTLQWNDGLPETDKEQIEMLRLATGGRAVMSQYAALKRMGLSDDAVENELEQMEAESAADYPINLRTVEE